MYIIVSSSMSLIQISHRADPTVPIIRASRQNPTRHMCLSATRRSRVEMPSPVSTTGHEQRPHLAPAEHPGEPPSPFILISTYFGLCSCGPVPTRQRPVSDGCGGLPAGARSQWPGQYGGSVAAVAAAAAARPAAIPGSGAGK